MFSKLIYMLILLAFAGTVLTAQTQTQRTKRKKKQSAQTQQSVRKTGSENKQEQKNTQEKKATSNQTVKKDPQQEIRRLMRLDPRMPGFGATTAKQQLDDIRKNYVQREFPRKVKDFRPGDSNTATGLRVTAFSYKKNLAHPDLEEATGIRLSWFNQAGAAFVALYQYLDEVERGAMMGQEKRYVMSALKYKELAKKLEQILDKPEKIPSGELAKIKEANTQRRKKEIQKKINELMRQRRSER